jgi:hypothetical protein
MDSCAPAVQCKLHPKVVVTAAAITVANTANTSMRRKPPG